MRKLGKGLVEVHSAGLVPMGVNPNAAEVMKEIGIDISGQTSDEIDTELLNSMDVVITLCSNAESACPQTHVNVKRIHWPIDDPVGSDGSREEVLGKYRNARDEILGLIKGFLSSLAGSR